MNAGVPDIFCRMAVDPGAVRKMIEAIRCPFAPPADGLGLGVPAPGDHPRLNEYRSTVFQSGMQTSPS